MKYWVVYNIFSKNISAYCYSEIDNFEKLFSIMKAELKNGDIVLEIIDRCNGIVSGYKNCIQCQQIIINLANEGNLTHTES